MGKRIRDWVEDREHYENECVFCHAHFLGNKGRRCCRFCHYWPRIGHAVLYPYLGIVPSSSARMMGFTHHARLFGLLPCYYRADDPAPCLEMKWQPLWLIEVPLRFLWCLVWVACGKGEPQFGIMVGKEL